ncbi:MAG: multicopper oxidase domain-containing protein [Halobacteriovoraceae bacterium]|nr:multicopper oxidase domain-containing protein [Halobacteriovoraceae bacterium]MCB9095528.1 multicopper oxidase domain-containing protein [Halobacteriovoraceae bacterium]
MKLIYFFSALFVMTNVFAKEVHYELNIANKTVNFTGKDVDHALAINDSIPAPTLKFHLGDTAIIKVNNNTDEPTTMHWHGVLVPWDQDGPQFSNTKLIEPGQSHVFTFPIIHTGTYWYHSHTELHEQRGLYGAIVIEDKVDKYKVDHDIVLVLSDWIDEHPQDVLENLKMDGDYYAYKKKFFPSIWGAIKHGKVWDYIKSEWTKMGPMDLSDVGYDAFLVNGRRIQKYPEIKPGEKVRLRIIDAGASTFYYLNLGNFSNFKVIAKDGVEVAPVQVNEILMGMGETYDLTFKMPLNNAVELRATSQDITGYASVIFGADKNVEKVLSKLKPNPYGMNHEHHSGHSMSQKMDHTNHSQHKMGNMPMVNRLKYSMLKSPQKTMFDPKLPRRDYNLALNGDMERYYWTINGKSFSEDKYIMVRFGEVVRIHFTNETMMHHPMHLHGHFFRVLNGAGDFAPNFHTVDVSPMGTVTIEFHANSPGIWFLHCHNLYHMKMGMARYVKYEDFQRPEVLLKDEQNWANKMKKDSDAFLSADIGGYTNFFELQSKASMGRYQFDLNMEADEYNLEYLEGQAIIRRFSHRFLSYYAGSEYEDEELHAILGLSYMLKFRAEFSTHLRSDKSLIVDLMKEFPVAPKTMLEIEGRGVVSLEDTSETDWELHTSLLYQVGNRTRIGINYRKNENIGDSFAVGVKVNLN